MLALSSLIMTVSYTHLHALVAAKQKHSAPVHKITIIPRTSGALGYTMQVEEGEKVLMSKEEALAKITPYTGGRAAEELIFGTCTSGASNDIEQATKLARAMVTRLGMSDEFDMMALETVTNQYLGGDASLTCSADTAAKIDDKVLSIIKDAHRKALQILHDNKDKMCIRDRNSARRDVFDNIKVQFHRKGGALLYLAFDRDGACLLYTSRCV